MYKKFISLSLSLLMILGSVNIAHAAVSTAEIIPESWFCIRGNGNKYTDKTEKDSDRKIFVCDSPSSPGNRCIGYIRFDLTDYLKQLYFADSVTFSINPEKITANKETSFDLSIISDGLENYDVENITYNEVIDSGMYNDFSVFYHADNAGTVDVHTTGNIKSNIIKALESGNNNTIVIKVSNKDDKGAILLPDSIKLNITYNTNSISDSAYCSLMANKFDINSVDGISSDTVDGDFDLPLFYKGVEILWSSNNDAIKILPQDDQRAVVTKDEASPTPVTLTAAFTDKSLLSFVLRSFDLKVAQIEPIDMAAKRFNENYKVSEEDYGSITKKLNLVSVFEGYSVTWVSSNNSVINANTGEVTASRDADVTVTLTPTISSDGSSRTLNTINVTVKRDTTTTVNLSPASEGALLNDNRILTTDWKPDTYINGARFGIINFDLTKYLPELYLANTVNLKVKSGNNSDNKYFSFALKIIPDSREVYADLTHTYSEAVTAGVLTDGIEIFSSSQIGSYNTVHTSSDIKDALIKALESGDNNNISLRLVASDGNVALERGSELIIKYDEATVSDEAYYKKILESFDIEAEANITSDAIDDSFHLPTFYKGSKITWTSDKENITVSSDGAASVTKSAESDELVTLTANLSYKDGSSYPKDFTLKVLEKDYMDDLADSFNETYRVSDEDYSAITKNLTLDKTFERATLSWVSSNEAVVKAETGRVIRSETEDISVTLTPTIFYDEVSRTLNPINVTVKKIDATTETIKGESLTIKSSEVLTNQIFTAESSTNPMIGFINLDLTECLQKLYLANSVKLTVKPNCWGNDRYNKFSLEIIPDSKEVYTDNNHYYNEAVDGGVLSDGTEILPAKEIGYAGSSSIKHQTDDIKDVLIKALESGNNNKLSIRLVLAEVVQGISQIGIQIEPILEIKYDASLLTD